MELLDYLLSHDLAPDEKTARGLIMRGDVLVNDKPVTSPHARVNPESFVRVRGGVSSDVSRGAQKIRPVIERCGIDLRGHVALDLGISTGGFTQVLLENGSKKVYAVDVAYGVTALAVRNDPRVVLLERTNARDLTTEHIPEPVSRAVGDLSFISWRAVLPALVPLLADQAQLLLLVKPQFELSALGRDDLVDGGIVRDSGSAQLALVSLYNELSTNGLNPVQVYPAGLRGSKGNQEYFIHLDKSCPIAGRSKYIELVNTAMDEALK